MFDTVEKVVDDILTQLHADDIAAFKKMTLEEARFLHHGFGTWIRNTYSLWHTSPLTEKWRADSLSFDALHEMSRDELMATHQHAGNSNLTSMSREQLIETHHESTRVIEDGVDYSEDHPDQMSSTIIDVLWHKLR